MYARKYCLYILRTGWRPSLIKFNFVSELFVNSSITICAIQSQAVNYESELFANFEQVRVSLCLMKYNSQKKETEKKKTLEIASN